MSARSAPRYSRRSFLKFGAAAAAGMLALRLPPPAPIQPVSHFLRVKSALPLLGYGFLPFPEQLLHEDFGHVDAALVPAYVAAQLIQQGLLQPLSGPAGRAHDPEGRYTLPFAYRVAALSFGDEAMGPASVSWDDLWSAAGGALAPAFARVISGAALLRRGYSPNDNHPGHLAQAGEDLKRLRPRIVPQWRSPFPNILMTGQSPALVLADPNELGQANGLRLPAAGTMLIEYDWVITAGWEQAGAARRFIDGLRPAAQALRSDLPVRLIPLMPLSAAAHTQQREMWVALTAASV